MKLAIDWRAFAQELANGLEPFVKQLGTDGAEVVARVRSFQGRVESTLQALELEVDAQVAQDLKASLTTVLPAEAAAIKSIAVSKLSSDLQAGLEAALDVSVRIAISIAKGFVPALGALDAGGAGASAVIGLIK